MARYIFRTLFRFLDNGTYIPVSKDFGIRRYVFPKHADLQKKLCESLKNISKTVYENDLPAFPFLHGDHTSLSNRIVCLIYERKDKKQQPIGLHLPFVTKGCGEDIIHAGLILVDKAHQGKRVVEISGINFMLFLVLHGSHFVFTSLSSKSFNLRLMEKYSRDTYPTWRNPDLKPTMWHVDIAKFMLANHRQDLSNGDTSFLDENTLVVRGYSKSDGSKHFVQNISRSRNPALRKFMEDRLNVSNGDAQFTVGRVLPVTKYILRTIFM